MLARDLSVRRELIMQIDKRNLFPMFMEIQTKTFALLDVSPGVSPIFYPSSSVASEDLILEGPTV